MLSFLRSSSFRSLCDLSRCATLFPWCSNQWFLLATEWSVFSFVLKISKILLPLSLACAQDIPQTNLCVLLDSLSNSNSKVIFPFPQLLFFPKYSSYFDCASRSACHWLSSVGENEICCDVGGIIPSSGCRRRFYWRPFVHLSLILRTNKRAPFVERKRTAIQPVPNQKLKEKTTQTSVTTKEAETGTHPSQQAHSSQSHNHTQTPSKDHTTSHPGITTTFRNPPD